jgi:hypothetical protein
MMMPLLNSLLETFDVGFDLTKGRILESSDYKKITFIQKTRLSATWTQESFVTN